MPMSAIERQEVNKLKADVEELTTKLEDEKRKREITEKSLAGLQAPKPARLRHGELTPPRIGREL